MPDLVAVSHVRQMYPLQVFWPDDKTWWPGRVTALNLKKCEMTLFYETGAVQVFNPSSFTRGATESA